MIGSSFIMGSLISRLCNPLLYLFASIFLISAALLLFHCVTLLEGDID